MKRTAILCAAACVTACTAAAPDTMSKHEARIEAAKADGVDYCELYTWYGDGECDGFCARPDPDCTGVLDEFRISVAGACPSGVDCSSFISIDGSGTLRVDYLDDPDGLVHRAVVPEDVIALVLPVVTDAALVDTLSDSTPPCPVPIEVAEVMQLNLDGADVGNLTTFCATPEVAAARNVMHQLVGLYLPRFTGFRLEVFALCDPGTDCAGSVELFPDGTLEVDFAGETPQAMHRAVLGRTRMAEAVRTLTNRHFVEVLAKDQPPCALPTDYHESMELGTAGKAYRQLTSLCDHPELTEVRGYLRTLIQDKL